MHTFIPYVGSVIVHVHVYMYNILTYVHSFLGDKTNLDHEIDFVATG